MLVQILPTAVKKFPQFNASIDAERGELIYKKFVNVGVAVDTDRGLLVPVIRNADRKNIQEIAIEINQLAAKARDEKLTLEEMSGGGIERSPIWAGSAARRLRRSSTGRRWRSWASRAARWSRSGRTASSSRG